MDKIQKQKKSIIDHFQIQLKNNGWIFYDDNNDIFPLKKYRKEEEYYHTMQEDDYKKYNGMAVLINSFYLASDK